MSRNPELPQDNLPPMSEVLVGQSTELNSSLSAEQSSKVVLGGIRKLITDIKVGVANVRVGELNEQIDSIDAKLSDKSSSDPLPPIVRKRNTRKLYGNMRRAVVNSNLELTYASNNIGSAESDTPNFTDHRAARIHQRNAAKIHRRSGEVVTRDKYLDSLEMHKQSLENERTRLISKFNLPQISVDNGQPQETTPEEEGLPNIELVKDRVIPRSDQAYIVALRAILEDTNSTVSKQYLKSVLTKGAVDYPYKDNAGATTPGERHELRKPVDDTLLDFTLKRLTSNGIVGQTGRVLGTQEQLLLALLSTNHFKPTETVSPLIHQLEAQENTFLGQIAAGPIVSNILAARRQQSRLRPTTQPQVQQETQAQGAARPKRGPGAKQQSKPRRPKPSETPEQKRARQEAEEQAVAENAYRTAIES